MAHFRATVSDRHDEMWDALKTQTGITKTVALLEHLITDAYYRYCYSSSIADVRVKAALVLSRHRNFSLSAADIERVSFSGKAVQIWTVHSGEPYVLSEQQWR